MTAFENYVDMYGFHFSKKLYDFAVSLMRDRSGNEPKPVTKEQVADKMKALGVSIKNDKGYDVAYVYQMAMADYYGSSLRDEAQLALFVKDYLDDVDGNKTKAFDHFVIDTRIAGEPIFWEEMM